MIRLLRIKEFEETHETWADIDIIDITEAFEDKLLMPKRFLNIYPMTGQLIMLLMWISHNNLF